MTDGRKRDGTSATSHEAALSEIAHAFRTPLGVITGYVQLLQLRDDPALRVDALRHIEEAATRLVGAVDLLISVLESDTEGLSELFLERSNASQRTPPPGGEHLARGTD